MPVRLMNRLLDVQHPPEANQSWRTGDGRHAYTESMDSDANGTADSPRQPGDYLAGMTMCSHTCPTRAAHAKGQ